MKHLFIAAIITFVGLNANAQTKKPAVTKKPVTSVKKPVAKAPIFKNKLDSASYALGISVAGSFKNGGLNTVNYTLFNKGIKDMFANANPLLNQQQCQEAISNLFESFSAQREAIAKKQEETEKVKHAPTVQAGEKFLAENKVKPGIKTTASGLQYEVITPGTGKKPTAEDQVTVNYKGTLLNGTKFDASEDHGGPATFGLGQVIKGWTEGVQLMQEGAKYRFFVPYNLAYGSRATPDGSIPPFSTLIFEVELVKVGGTEN